MFVYWFFSNEEHIVSIKSVVVVIVL